MGLIFGALLLNIKGTLHCLSNVGGALSGVAQFTVADIEGHHELSGQLFGIGYVFGIELIGLGGTFLVNGATISLPEHTLVGPSSSAPFSWSGYELFSTEGSYLVGLRAPVGPSSYYYGYMVVELQPSDVIIPVWVYEDEVDAAVIASSLGCTFVCGEPGNWPSRRMSRNLLPSIPEKRTIPFFLHIPKTGGSTLISVMQRDNKEQLQTFTNPPFSDLQSTIKDQTVTSIAGHVALSSIQAAIQQEDVEIVPFVILNDPTRRAISFWRYIKDLYDAPDLSLKDFLTGSMGNTMYRMMAPMGSDLADKAGTLARIKDAIRNDFAVVGLTSKFDETMVLLQDMGLVGEDISYNRHKVLSNPEHPYQLSAEESLLMNQFIHLDQQIYDFAVRNFEEVLLQQDAAFHQRVQLFKESQAKRTPVACEDDDFKDGAWKCDPQERQEMFAQVRKQIKEAMEGMHPQLLALELLRETKRPRYW